MSRVHDLDKVDLHYVGDRRRPIRWANPGFCWDYHPKFHGIQVVHQNVLSANHSNPMTLLVLKAMILRIRFGTPRYGAFLEWVGWFIRAPTKMDDLGVPHGISILGTPQVHHPSEGISIRASVRQISSVPPQWRPLAESARAQSGGNSPGRLWDHPEGRPPPWPVPWYHPPSRPIRGSFRRFRSTPRHAAALYGTFKGQAVCWHWKSRPQKRWDRVRCWKNNGSVRIRSNQPLTKIVPLVNRWLGGWKSPKWLELKDLPRICIMLVLDI